MGERPLAGFRRVIQLRDRRRESDKAVVVTKSVSPPYVMCIDGGTESARVGVLDRSGNLLSVASHPYATRFPRAGWAEQDPSAWWGAVIKAARACLDGGPVKPRDVAGICLDATTCTLLPLDADGQHLRPALLWMDVRAAGQADRIFQTGHPAMRYSPAGCNAEWMLSKALWLAENEPETYDRTAHFVEYTDWLIYKLTGRLVLNQSTATHRWYYNAREWRWPTDLYAQIGLPDLAAKFPQEVLPAGTEVGRLQAEAARALGLSDSVRVFQGGGDAFVGLLGMNVVRPGRIGLITGSSNVVGAFADEAFHRAGLYGAFPEAIVPGLWLVEAGQVSTGSVLAWFARNFARELPADAVYAILDSEADQVEPGAGGVTVLDYFQGNRTPHTDARARGAIWGLSLHTTRGHLFRALMEGIAYGTRHILDLLADSGCEGREVFACGGATHSKVFMQIYADVCGMPISVPEIGDAPLLGGAILAYTAMGAYPNLRAAARAMVRVSRTYTPDLALHRSLQANYQLYKQTYPQLRGLMRRAAGNEQA